MKKRALAFLVAAAAAILLWPVRLLVLTDGDGQSVFMKRVSPGERYTVRFIHSVMRRPVDEVYEIAPNCSVLKETWFDMGGAGLPLDYVNPKLHFTFENNLYHITGYDMELPDLVYRVNKVVADHTLLIGGRQYKMKQWTRPGGPIHFRVKRMPAARLIWFKLRQSVNL